MAFVPTCTNLVNTSTTFLSSSAASSFLATSRNAHPQRTLTTTSKRAWIASADASNNSAVDSTSGSASGTSAASSNGVGATTPDKITLTYDNDDEVREVILDENIAGFCSIDPNTGKRLDMSYREKEALFLDAVQSYFRGETVLSDEEFDMLKEELTWQGSDVVTLDRDEYLFLDAARAYEQGKPVMDDVAFDGLKKKLFDKGSIVAIQRGPRCSIQRKITFSDIIPDKKRTFALYVPAGLIIALSWLSIAFEFTPLHQIDPVLSLIIGSPIIYIGSRITTGLVVPQAQIMVGDCPSCGRRTHVLFGDVLNQKGYSNVADVKCQKCKAELKIELESSRMILMKEGKAA